MKHRTYKTHKRKKARYEHLPEAAQAERAREDIETKLLRDLKDAELIPNKFHFVFQETLA